MFQIAMTTFIIGWAVGFVTYFAIRSGVHLIREYNEEFGSNENLNYPDNEKGNVYYANHNA